MIVVATDTMTAASEAPPTRMNELRASAVILGAHRERAPGLRRQRARPRVLEATMPRDVVERLVRLIRALRIPFRYNTDALRAAYSPGSAITHRVNVRRFARRSGRHSPRTAPRSTARQARPRHAAARQLLLGREWFVHPARTPVTEPATKIFSHQPTGPSGRP